MCCSWAASRDKDGGQLGILGGGKEKPRGLIRGWQHVPPGERGRRREERARMKKGDYSPGPSSHHPSLWSKAAWQKEPWLLVEAPGEAVVGP